jgi:hypothetical protein
MAGGHRRPQQVTRGRRQTRSNLIEGPNSFPGDLDQAGVAELAHVVGNRRLAQPECGGEVAYTHRLSCFLERSHHLQPGGIGEEPEQIHGGIHGSGLEFQVYLAAVAPLANRKDYLHAVSLPNILTLINASRYAGIEDYQCLGRPK